MIYSTYIYIYRERVNDLYNYITIYPRSPKTIF